MQGSRTSSHTAHTPTTHHQHSNTDTTGLMEMFCFVYVSPYHTIIRQRLARVGGESQKGATAKLCIIKYKGTAIV